MMERSPVIKYEFCGASRYTGYMDKSIRLTLKCGHETYRKASQKIPLTVECRECARKGAKR